MPFCGPKRIKTNTLEAALLPRACHSEEEEEKEKKRIEEGLKKKKKKDVISDELQVTSCRLDPALDFGRPVIKRQTWEPAELQEQTVIWQQKNNYSLFLFKAFFFIN